MIREKGENITRHYEHIPEDKIDELFYIKPMEFNKYTPKELLANALGATMYTPATNEKIAANLIKRKYPALTSNVLCLEDAIGDNEVEQAEVNLLNQLDILNSAIEVGTLKKKDLPLLFIRVRTPEQLTKLLEHGEKFKYITGFNIPKFTSQNGEKYLLPIVAANKKYNENFYALPILETPEIIYKETRMEELSDIKDIIYAYREIILNIRLGGTDFSSLFGIRRGVDFTIYDIQVIRDVLTDVLNVFSRASENYTISGVVWEYFPDKTRLLKPQLRYTPFFLKKGSDGMKQRKELICKEIDGLLKEVILDKSNNFVGKTVIHPSHITYVNGLQVVTYDEYMDALDIINNTSGGVIKGRSGNKMNEIKPHYNWAKKVIAKSKVYGVLQQDAEYIQLF